MSLIDLCFPDSVGFTYLGHDGSKSWLDHIAVSNCFCSSVVSVHSIRDGRNLSDHNPLAFSLDLFAPVAPCTTSTPDGPSVRWHLATSDDICRYQQAVQCSLVSLSSLLRNDVVLCCEPSCTAHQDLLERVCTKLVSSLKAAAESSIPRSGQRRRTGVAGWSQFVKPELETSGINSG